MLAYEVKIFGIANLDSTERLHHKPDAASAFKPSGWGWMKPQDREI